MRLVIQKDDRHQSSENQMILQSDIELDNFDLLETVGLFSKDNRKYLYGENSIFAGNLIPLLTNCHRTGIYGN